MDMVGVSSISLILSFYFYFRTSFLKFSIKELPKIKVSLLDL